MHYYSSDDVKAGKISSRMSPHQLGLLEIVEICKLRDAAPQQLEFFCAVPKRLDTSIELSPELAQRVPEIAALVLNRLREIGVTATPRASEQDH